MGFSYVDIVGILTLSTQLFAYLEMQLEKLRASAFCCGVIYDTVHIIFKDKRFFKSSPFSDVLSGLFHHRSFYLLFVLLCFVVVVFFRTSEHEY